MRRHSCRCHKCHDFVEVEFTRGPSAPLDVVGRSRRSGLTAKDFAWFAGECPRCGKVLLEEREGGGKSIACSILSRHGKVLLKCSCGGTKRMRSGRI